MGDDRVKMALLLGCALAALPMKPAIAQQSVPPVQPQAIKSVKPGFYMVTGAGGNVTVWVAEHGLILVDDKNAGDANFDNLVAQIRTVSTLPVRAVFNTHLHGDHIGNNARFIDAGVLVIGTDGLADRVEHAAPPAGNAAPAAPAAPSLRFSKDFSLVLGSGRVDAHHYWPGHTDGDAVIFFPRARIVAVGDMLVAATPNFDYPGGTNIGGWIQSLDAVLKLDFDMAIPGHGDAPMTRAGVEAFRGKLATFLDRARAAIRNGASKETLIAAIKVDDLGWTWSATAWPAARLDGLWAEAGGKRDWG
jgi:glyoxylase-like metal-dependent hydrolase (beta-lactamase superfamily II)